jgi:hypothetical protein
MGKDALFAMWCSMMARLALPNEILTPFALSLASLGLPILRLSEN